MYILSTPDQPENPRWSYPPSCHRQAPHSQQGRWSTTSLVCCCPLVQYFLVCWLVTGHWYWPWLPFQCSLVKSPDQDVGLLEMYKRGNIFLKVEPHVHHVNGLFNVATLGAEARDQYAQGYRFWPESWFLWREEKQRKTLGVRSRSTSLSPRTSPRSNLGCSSGRCRWWPLHQPDFPHVFVCVYRYIP